MGFFVFMLGTACGVYIAQNYNIPNIKKVYQKVTNLEKANRKNPPNHD